MQQPNIPRVRAPSDLTQTSIAIVIGNQVFGVPAIELGDAFGFQPLDGDLTAIAALTTTTYGRSLLTSVSASALFASIKQAADTTTTGVVELATNAETQTGTDATRAVTPAGLRSATRELLLANRTYYVRADGSDSNTGLVDSSGGAFLTIQKAVDVATALDLSIYSVTIQVGAGTYTAAVSLKSYTGVGPITIQGDTTTPSNVLHSLTAGNNFAAINVIGRWRLAGMKLTNTANFVAGIYCENSIVEWSSMDFGAISGTSSFHTQAILGGKLQSYGNYNITGGATAHHYSTLGGLIKNIGKTITITGTPAFSNWFVGIFSNSVLQINGNTFSGSATGSRYSVGSGAVIDVNGAGTSYLPGNAAGAGTNFGASPWGLYA